MTTLPQPRRAVRFALLAAVAMMVPSCSLNVPEPSDSLGNQIAGTYTVATFNVTPAGSTTVNLIAAGARFTLTLGANRSVAGQLFIPNGTPLPAGTFNMAGTWDRTIVGGFVNIVFNQQANTFVREASWQPRSFSNATGPQHIFTQFTLPDGVFVDTRLNLPPPPTPPTQ